MLTALFAAHVIRLAGEGVISIIIEGSFNVIHRRVAR
jgi:hypothetical protein